MTYIVHSGNNLDILPTLPDNSVDSIVTDPPYELGFMGKKWDNSGIAYSVELWTECLRVLKPGGHLLSFGGSRTWHRVAVAIEDSGFELRDSIAWMYGSGFPKSLDVSKAIDKGTGENQKRQLKFTAWVRATGITARQIDDITGTKMGSHYTTHPTQPAIATADLFDKLRPYLPEVPEEIERLVAERTGIEWKAYKNREVLGTKFSGIANREEKERHTIGASKAVEVDITAPSTPEAQQWEGWGTALKPAFEPIVVARKPLGGTVAANVLEHGTGALNIDGSRIGTEGGGTDCNKRDAEGNCLGHNGTGKFSDTVHAKQNNLAQGRWPANVILDEYTAGLLDEQSGVSKSSATPRHNSAGQSVAHNAERENTTFGHNDSGGASRFFYCAKASKSDRNEGLEELDSTTAADMVEREPDSAGMNSPRAGAGRTSGAKNFHPTVKPTNLMQYLVKLVTPPNGTVLDPFTGSGSTGKAAILNGFDFIGIELTEEYLPIIEGRLKWAEQEVARSEAKKDEALF